MNRLSDRADFIPADSDAEVISGDLALLAQLVIVSEPAPAEMESAA